MMLGKQNFYNINKKDANEALQNVFAACDVEPNDTPLEVIRVWNIANNVIATVGFYVSIVLLVFILLMPLAFRHKDSVNTKGSSYVNVLNHHIEEDGTVFVMQIEGLGIDYSGIYAKSATGEVILPLSIDEKEQIIKFPFTENNLNIYIPKMDGTITQAVLSK